MDRLRAASRKYVIVGASAVALVMGAVGLGLYYPPLGPIAGTLAPQAYVDTITDGDFPQKGPFVLVDAASARLFMIEDGRVEDSMKVIVGKPGSDTPAFKATMTYATLNPYWNVPPDLARKIIAPRVVSDGKGYLTDRGYDVVTKVGAEGEVLPWNSVDWKAVRDGRATVQVRQRPGPYNSMGHLKFNLARADGIFLHDTPHKELFDKPERTLSNGCVRLQDAPRLARWLIGNDPKLASSAPEQNLALPRSVPVEIAYLGSNAQTQLAGLR